MGREFGSSLASWLRPKISHEIAVNAGQDFRFDRTGGSTSKTAHLYHWKVQGGFDLTRSLPHEPLHRPGHKPSPTTSSKPIGLL